MARDKQAVQSVGIQHGDMVGDSNLSMPPLTVWRTEGITILGLCCMPAPPTQPRKDQIVCFPQVYMHYPFEREVPSGLPKTELPLDRPFGELCISP